MRQLLSIYPIRRKTQQTCYECTSPRHLPETTQHPNGALRPDTRKRVQLRHRFQAFADPYRVRLYPRAIQGGSTSGQSRQSQRRVANGALFDKSLERRAETTGRMPWYGPILRDCAMSVYKVKGAAAVGVFCIYPLTHFLT